MLQAHLSHLVLGAANPNETRRFYEDHVGLRTEPGGSAAEAEERLALHGEYALGLRVGSGLGHFALEIADDGERSALVCRLRERGIGLSEVPEDPEHPMASAFTDPDGHRVEIHSRVERHSDAVGGPRHQPVRLHHITLSTADVPSLVDFYVTTLGFAVSDWMGSRFAWLRCNNEHHTVAIVEGSPGGLDHYCYEVRDWEELKVWCDELAAGGVPVSWGPGRHGPGNNLFIMFDDPDGVHIELSCEMERFWDDNARYGEPRDWQPGLRTVNLWGPAPEWRRPLEEVR